MSKITYYAISMNSVLAMSLAGYFGGPRETAGRLTRSFPAALRLGSLPAAACGRAW